MADASGTPYRPGARFNILSNVNLYSQWGDVSLLDGCFADSSTSGINLSNYSPDLIARLNSATNLGYMLSDPTRSDQTKTFKTRLTGNINKYITSRYCPRYIDVNNAVNTIWNDDISDAAHIAPLLSACPTNNANVAPPNVNRYYYYK